MSYDQLLPGEGLRKLASVRPLDSVEPHPDADKLAIGCFGGWQVVVGIESQPGDLFLFFEQDAIVGELVVKPRKIRGALSEAYAVRLEVGVDLSEALGIKKKVNAAPAAQTTASPPIFSSCGVPKTDEERWQNVSQYLSQLHEGGGYQARVKYDGSSGTFGYVNGEFTCHNRKLPVQGGAWGAVAERYKLADVLAAEGGYAHLAIQGEVIGPKIQGNPYKLDAPDFKVFDIYDYKARAYFSCDELREFCHKWRLQLAELVATHALAPGESVDISDLQRLADAQYEGVVIRPWRELRDRLGNRISFKVIRQGFA